jgi:hypothetical protein
MNTFDLSGLRKRAGALAVSFAAVCVSLSAVAQGNWAAVRVTTAEQVVAAMEEAARTRIPTALYVAPGHYRFTQGFSGVYGRSALPPIATSVSVWAEDPGSPTTFDASKVDGRLFTVLSSGSLKIRGLTLTGGGFTASIASRGGGAIANLGGFLRLDDSRVIGNGTGAAGGAQGGAILSVGGKLHLERTTLLGNLVDGEGGGVAIYGGNGIIRDSIISGNRARNTIGSGGSGAGGGLFVADAVVSIANTTLSGNLASTSGGGLYNRGTVWLTNSAVIENAIDDEGDHGDGGGVFNGGVMLIRDATVGANSAGTFGGGVFNTGNLVLEGATVARNEARAQMLNCAPERGPCNGGGGIWNADGGKVRVARTVLADNTMQDLGTGNGFPVAKGPDCSGVIVSEGFNAVRAASGCELQRSYRLHGLPTHDLIGIDPLLGVLIDAGDAGGAHYSIEPGSPLIDAGGSKGDGCSAADQIGQPRADGSGDGVRKCDIGAIEAQSEEITQHIAFSNITTSTSYSYFYNATYAFVWDDLQLSGGGLLKRLSVVVANSRPNPQPGSNIAVEFRRFDNPDGGPLGTLIGRLEIDMRGSVYSAENRILVATGLERFGIVLPQGERIAVGINFRDPTQSMGVVTFDPPTVGTSSAAAWVGDDPAPISCVGIVGRPVPCSFGWELVTEDAL